jgi:hypothetical protein
VLPLASHRLGKTGLHPPDVNLINTMLQAKPFARIASKVNAKDSSQEDLGASLLATRFFDITGLHPPDVNLINTMLQAKPFARIASKVNAKDSSQEDLGASFGTSPLSQEMVLLDLYWPGLTRSARPSYRSGLLTHQNTIPFRGLFFLTSPNLKQAW